jgi:hypothetical protein
MVRRGELVRIALVVAFLGASAAFVPMGIPSATAFTPPSTATWSNGGVSYWTGYESMSFARITSVAFSPETETIFAGVDYYNVLILNLSAGTLAIHQVFPYMPSVGNSDSSVRSLAFDAARQVLYAGSDRGIAQLDLRSKEVSSICPVTPGVWELHHPVGSDRIYAATSRGLAICNLVDGTVVLVDSSSGLPEDSTRAVRADEARGRVYLAVTPGLSIYSMEDGTVLNLGTSNELPTRYVYSIDLDPSGDRVFLGTNALSVLDATSLGITNYGVSPYPEYATVHDVASGLDGGEVYVSVVEFSLNPERSDNSRVERIRLHDSARATYTVDNGLPGGILVDLTFSPERNLVLGSAVPDFGHGGGVVLIDPSAPTLADETVSVAERGQSIPILAVASDPDGIERVVATYVGSAGWTGEIVLDRTTEDRFTGEIPAREVPGTVRYRLEATDATGRRSARPSYSEWSEIRVVDTTFPIVLGYGPTGASVPTDTEIVLSFSESMVLASVREATSIYPSASMGAATADGAVVRIPLPSLGSGTTYTVYLAPGPRDLYGNELDADGDGTPGGTLFWSFRTAQAAEPPRLFAIGPARVAPGEWIRIRVHVEAPEPIVSVRLQYEDVNRAAGDVSMTRLGSLGDEEVWEADIPAQSGPGLVRYRVVAEDEAGRIAAYPDDGMAVIEVVALGPSTEVAIATIAGGVVATVGAAAAFRFLRRRHRA